jgi:hypothetical protein
MLTFGRRRLQRAWRTGILLVLLLIFTTHILGGGDYDAPGASF